MAYLSDSTDPTDSDHMPSLELDQILNASIEIEDSRRLDLVGGQYQCQCYLGDALGRIPSFQFLEMPIHNTSARYRPYHLIFSIPPLALEWVTFSSSFLGASWPPTRQEISFILALTRHLEGGKRKSILFPE